MYEPTDLKTTAEYKHIEQWQGKNQKYCARKLSRITVSTACYVYASYGRPAFVQKYPGELVGIHYQAQKQTAHTHNARRPKLSFIVRIKIIISLSQAETKKPIGPKESAYAISTGDARRSHLIEANNLIMVSFLPSHIECCTPLGAARSRWLFSLSSH